MLIEEKTSIYHAIELSLREISYVLYVHANEHVLMTQKMCAVGIRNAKLGNHLNFPCPRPTYRFYCLMPDDFTRQRETDPLGSKWLKNSFNTAILSTESEFCSPLMTRLTGFTVLSKDYQSRQGQLQQR